MYLEYEENEITIQEIGKILANRRVVSPGADPFAAIVVGCKDSEAAVTAIEFDLMFAIHLLLDSLYEAGIYQESYLAEKIHDLGISNEFMRSFLKFKMNLGWELNELDCEFFKTDNIRVYLETEVCGEKLH